LRKRILITGGSGYLASSIAYSLLNNKSYKISVCSNSNIKFNNPSIKTYNIDWKNLSSINKICTGQDIIIHCASPDASFASNFPKESYEFNSVILESFLNEAVKKNVKKFIYFSSVHIYKSIMEGNINENSKIYPVHPYGISKKIAEETIFKYKNLIEINIIRLSNVFGIPTNENKNCWKLVINDFCKQVILNKEIKINSDGTQIRNFVSLNELCRLIDFIIKYFCDGKLLPEVFNFGGDLTLSIRDLAKLIAKKYKALYKLNPPIKIKNNFDFSIKNKSKLNFDFSLILECGFVPFDKYNKEIIDLFLHIENNFSNE
tara:strand:+ start:3671 stop:4624 length:954 start_codon:yes stop_codon:yes gene_type:complete